MKKIDPKNKTCIYLDQFVISDIIEGVNPIWTEIKNLLESNYNLGKIYCPLCPEHILETVRKDFKSAEIHDNYLRSISDGYLLKSEPFLTAQLISSLIRKNKKTINTFLTKAKFNDLKDFYEDINKHHDKFSDGITTNLSDQNNFRKIVSNKIDKKTEIQFIEVIKQNEINNFKNRLKEYLDIKAIRIRADKFGEMEVPNWIDQLLYQLTYKHKFKKKELELLLLELEKNGFSRIPTLNTKFSIGAHLAVKGKQEKSGDHIDIMRISSYLFSTDIFFTDKKRKHEICELRIDKKYNTIVFSGVQNDLEEFINILKKMQ
ncbi:hypothetical protein H9Q08_17220 [Chryseobacterium sp. PS-8]|uniref:Uncharacterized protein n=1 Tax=Chryseobacterium indicum TaxID=2766954 RepID=A0ABS9C8Y9_9FLAO|nr:hypothetical protein [Chryseobacterium sp. PS-8]MCF2221029.1 hypothetical protein [Chryseobacterium sp. PS-8]